MNDKNLKRYKGKLTHEQLIIAYEKALKNAKNLFEEAEILFKQKKYARAYFLLCISSEELGKSIIIISAIVDLIKDKLDWKEFWKHLRNHKIKTGTIMHIENIFISNELNFTEPNDIEKNIPDMEELKMTSLYTDIYQNDFLEPEEIITHDMTESLMDLISKRINFFTVFLPSIETLKNMNKKQVSVIEKQFRKK